MENGVDQMLEKITTEKEESEKKAEQERIKLEEREKSEKIQKRLDQIQNSSGLSKQLSNEMTQNTTMNNTEFQPEHKFPSPVEQSENNKDLSFFQSKENIIANPVQESENNKNASFFQNQENIINRQNINTDNNLYMDRNTKTTNDNNDYMFKNPKANSEANSNTIPDTRPEAEQHESRQNIVSDAKICTENLQTGFQNIQEKFSESAERLKNLKENSYQPQELDQKSLVKQGMEISSNMRTNMDPNFQMHDEMAQGEEVSKKVVKPIPRDEKIDSGKMEEKREELPLESNDNKSKFYNAEAISNKFADKKVL